MVEFLFTKYKVNEDLFESPRLLIPKTTIFIVLSFGVRGCLGAGFAPPAVRVWKRGGG